MGLVAAAGKPAEEIRIAGVRFEELHRGGWDPDARMADQDATASPPRSSTRPSAWCSATTPTSTTRRPASTPTTAGSPSTAATHPDAPARLRPDGDAHARGRHRGPRGDQGARPARRDDAGQPRRRGLRLARLRRVLGGGDRARPAALVPHPHRPRLRLRPARARPEDERLPRHHPRLPGHHGHAGARRRVRAPPAAAHRLRRGRRRLGAALHVPHGPRLQAPPQLAAGRPGALEAARRSTSPRTSTRPSRTTGWRSRSPT